MNKFGDKNIIIAAALIVLVGVSSVGYFFYQRKQAEFKRRANETEKQFPKVQQQAEKDIEVIAENLNIPWEVAFLPNGEILVTERPGTLLLIKNRQKISIKGVATVGEGGLLGLSVHPDFVNNKYLYLYYTYSGTKNKTLNRVVRFKFENAKLTNEQVIVDAIPGAVNHNGGRINFGPDNFLYVTTGDAQNPSLAGKIIRVTEEGKPAPGNPFGNLVYSYGHRNPQGLAWDNQGRLWATEHGSQALDELNLIEKGANYGWPVIQGDAEKEGMVSPVIQSGPGITWAPAGTAFFDESIFFGGLRGEALFEYKIADKSLKRHFPGELGRIRAVVLGPDGYLYITTSNTDGRGTPKVGDDKLIRINPKVFR